REAEAIQTRLARVHVRVAAARQRLEPPPRPVDVKHVEVKAARAPRNGTIAAVLTAAGARTAHGAPLVAIELPERPRFRALVDRRVISSLSPGARATLRGADGRSYTGRVARVERVPDGTGFVEILPPRRARLDGGAAL